MNNHEFFLIIVAFIPAKILNYFKYSSYQRMKTLIIIVTIVIIILFSFHLIHLTQNPCN